MSDEHGVTRRTAREHEAIVAALQAMERALASPAPTREPQWIDRVRRELATVIGLVQEHCASAEAPDGLLGHVEIALGRTYEVSEARREHERLQRDAVSFLAALEDHTPEGGPSPAEVRERARALASALRAHQAREADLLLLAFQQDIGTGD